jgi:hypothetical protein
MNRRTQGSTVVVAVSPSLDTTINTATLTYSNGGKTVKNTGGTTNRSALSLSTKSSGKWYWEINIDATGGGASAVGVAGVGFNTAANPIGANTTNVIDNAAAVIWYNNSNTTGLTITTGDRMAIAFDVGTLTFWIGKVSAGVITWQGTSNPGTPTGGRVCAGITAPVQAMLLLNNLNDQFTLCLARADQNAATLPSGFSSWA